MSNAVLKSELEEDLLHSLRVVQAANDQSYPIDANLRWTIPVKAKFREIGQRFAAAKEFDNAQNIDIVVSTNSNPLVENLRALLATSVTALDADASSDNAQKILFETIEKATALLEQSVTVSQFPEPANDSRKALVRIYARFAKLLNRNSVDAISKDATEAIGALLKANAINPYVAGRGANPQAWVENEVVPKLDADMSQAAFNINVYLHTFEKFYRMLNDWRAKDKKGERKEGIDKFYVRK